MTLAPIPSVRYPDTETIFQMETYDTELHETYEIVLFSIFMNGSNILHSNNFWLGLQTFSKQSIVI